MIVRVPKDRVPEVYPAVCHHIARAIDVAGDRYGPAEIPTTLREGTRQLWLIMRDSDVRGAIVTVVYPEAGVCQLELGGGSDIELWRAAVREIEAWATSIGCATMEFAGRRGWLRVLDGYRQKAVIAQKALKEA